MLAKDVILSNYKSITISQRTQDIKNQCGILAGYLSGVGYLDEPSLSEPYEKMERLAEIYDGRVLLVDSDCVVVDDTKGVFNGKTLLAGEVLKCLSGESALSIEQDKNMISYALPLLDSEGTSPVGALILQSSTASVSSLARNLKRNADILQILMLAILALISLFVASVLVKPFNKVTQAITNIDNGAADTSISVRGYSETESIMFALKQLLLRLKTLDNSREEFVSNVSHELKTPLASMKVLADSLVMMGDEAPIEMYREFMQDITSEIDRENSIITDLLSLVKMDKTEGSLNIKSVNINEMLELILKRLGPIAAVNDIELIFESERSVEAEIDEVKLTLAFSNLIENGIKYNRKNGFVKVSLDADHQFFVVTVSDSGIGIPKESLDHIFERFYRVDKSHSREIGGTGLGLAITRSAILMHRGAVVVDSMLGEGTVFSVRIPLTYIQKQ